ncbi:esterase/lipase family protein [Parvularcula lutaonensis]|uniref:Esterase/lipase family protein n=1 Tax=Parvularcula lutaonensis TaxID=491923 RepID=A0ABV7MEN8_9PROT|nr:hypothetical protein [Parvularcula lutaonensis]GGY52028.1 hypothetical protein GCM10007148_21300 [Parvularcula lutaonensis]
MVRVITVHGTFAGDSKVSGTKWWQKGSPFLTRLQELIREPLQVEPFQWSGANSEIDRRKAGNRLAGEIASSQVPPIVIGHSHGGSAAIQALLLRYLKDGVKARERIRGVVTIGTPMFRFRSNRNPFSQFDVVGRLMLLFAIGLIAMKLGELATDTYDGREVTGFVTGLLEVALSLQVLLAALIIGGLFLYTRRNWKRQGLFKKNALYPVFRHAYLALNHENDEAINGLQKARALKPKLVKRGTVFVSIFSGLSFVLLAMFFGVQLLEIGNVPIPPVVGESYGLLEDNIIYPAQDALYAAAPNLAESPVFRQLLEVFTVVPVGAVVLFSAIVAVLTSFVVTPGLSEFVSTQIKSQSFGDDGYGETIERVAPGLDFEQSSVGTLPQEIEDEMIKASEEDAGAAIQRLRELLSSGELLDSKGADLIAQSVKFEKSELLHNAYFHSPLFIKYLAALMIERFGLTPSQAFEADADARAMLALVRG